MMHPPRLRLSLLLILLACAALVGCSGLSARQAQNLSDGLAGLGAVRFLIEADPAADPAAGTILTGAEEHVVAVAGGTEARAALPEPTLTSAAILADPAAYHAAGTAAREAAATLPWWGWALGALGAALGVVRCLPGPGGMVADLAWRLLSPGRHRAADAQRDAQASGFQTLLALIESVPGTTPAAQLKAQVGALLAPVAPGVAAAASERAPAGNLASGPPR